MYSHLTIGTSHVPNAARFYDSVLKPLGMVRRKISKAGICYAPEGFDGANEPFWVVRPLDNAVASPGNGVTVASRQNHAPRSMRSMRRRSPPAGATKARPDCARITIRIITEPM